MALFGKVKRTYEDIIEPLRQIESDLSEHIGNKTNEASELKAEKAMIDIKIDTARIEKLKSETTLVKISELLSD